MNLIKLVAALAVVPFLMGARPGTEYNLLIQLNGQPTRWVMPDGGRSGVFTAYDGGAANATACMPLTGATTGGGVPITPNLVLFVPLGAVNFCERPSAISPFWDGGCNGNPLDENFGVPLAALVPQYTTPDSVASTQGKLCFYSDAGYLAVPAWTVQ